MAGKSRKPVPPAAVPGARALIDDDRSCVAASSTHLAAGEHRSAPPEGTTATTPPEPSGTPAPTPVRRKRRARFVF